MTLAKVLNATSLLKNTLLPLVILFCTNNFALGYALITVTDLHIPFVLLTSVISLLCHLSCSLMFLLRLVFVSLIPQKNYLINFNTFISSS